MPPASAELANEGQTLLQIRRRLDRVALGDGHQPQVVEDQRDAAVVSQFPPQLQTLLEERPRPILVALLQPDGSQVVERVGDPALLAQLPLPRQGLLEQRRRAFRVAPVLGHQPQVIEGIGDGSLVSQVPLQRQGLLEQRRRPPEIALDRGQRARALQGNRPVATRPSGVGGQRALQPVPPFGHVATHVPEFPKRPSQPDRHLPVAPLQRPGEGGPQVGVLGFQPLQPAPLLRSRQFRPRPSPPAPGSRPRGRAASPPPRRLLPAAPAHTRESSPAW